MDDAFITALEEVVGLTPPQIQLLTDQSIIAPDTLALLDEDAMTDLFSKRPLSAATIIKKMKLKALRLWIQEKDDTDAEYNLDEFTVAKCTAMLKNNQMTAASSSFGREGNRSLNNGSTNNSNRKQGAIESGQRFISSTNVSKVSHDDLRYDFNKRTRAEIDSRADTVCAGSTFRLIEESNHYCVVNDFHKDMLPMQDIPVATVATAYDDPVSQETFILVFFEALYFGNTMEHSLISPMQLRHNGLQVDQTPRQYDPNSLHGITFPQDDDHNLFIPFHLHGSISYFSSRIPTDKEIQNCKYVYMTEDAI
mmetsp:Transcript_15766/g.22505  ORF Transcript_15766/g.22505 Transcript_15766/m.22505 type:complete len:309 (+) Transcript_15766:699-1625(+)